MDSTTRQARFVAWKRNTKESTCPMVLLPPEIKNHIISSISTQESLSSLGQTCRAWHEVAIEELYKRDSRENNSLAIKWMAAHAVDEQTTDSALRTLEISRRWGGQIDAIKPRRSRPDDEDETMYDTSTALHFAVFLGNVRLTKTLLDMKASLTIACSSLLWRSMRSEDVLRRVGYFRSVFKNVRFGPAFPIFLAFLKSDPDMCMLLVEHGAGREAWIFDADNDPKIMSILHFAAVDPTTDYRQWKCLFDGFREYIDEPWPQQGQYTPLHVAVTHGCTQGMQIAVECGADKEARTGSTLPSLTPLHIGMVSSTYHSNMPQHRMELPINCLRKFVELGASVNPEGASLLLLAVKIYARNPINQPNTRELIYLFLDHHADVHGSSRWDPNTNVVNEIVLASTSPPHENPLARRLVKELLSDLVDRGFNLRTPAPELPSPLYYVLHESKAKPKWLFDFLCENGATIHETEVDSAFICWCETSTLWEANKNNAWWQHQGQKDEMFLKWCEDPYQTWWWQHVKHISPDAATQAYGAAFKHKDRQLYDILTHLPLPAPLDGLLVRVAFEAKQLWSWRLVVHRKFEDNLLATLSFDDGENMIHLTVRKYVAERCYSTADAVLDVLHLRDKGVNRSSPNSHGQTPMELLLRLGSCKDDFMELVTLLEGIWAYDVPPRRRQRNFG
ncbi:uncharacterized protein CPUR_05639 [Claviceps purpurea 20.1]|uniref:F-box domain-containing protein n=1 Tax=Claviceps purpurea (strain 20.1) TaxID=1111077 RepID=M1WGG5_CLAP2|nr:uncharacterized protein CPUR_05639 [Claviceps purpurea 20.1]